jgi:hypothetical protein
MSCINSFWKTTLPGVAAMSLPSSNPAVARRCGSLASVAASARRLARPESRLIDPVSMARRIASGLVKAKLAGDSALR